jgi:hypothetical protein
MDGLIVAANETHIYKTASHAVDRMFATAFRFRSLGDVTANRKRKSAKTLFILLLVRFLL